MSTLIFFATIASLLFLSLRMMVLMLRRRRFINQLVLISIIALGYTAVWLMFYFTRTSEIVPLGTNICFDDWCATITKIEGPLNTTAYKQIAQSEDDIFILHVKMSNHAKGIAQKPSEPSIEILDNEGHRWHYSQTLQNEFEKVAGKQVLLDKKLELGQWLETQLIFDIPATAKNPKVLIEEGPYITHFLFPENRCVFSLTQ